MSEMSVTLGKDLMLNTYDYITPLGQKLQYYGNRLHNICPFLSYKYEITPEYHSLECFPISILENAYKHLEELVIIHRECWGNDNALNCKELLSSWNEFRKHIDNKYFYTHNILAIICQDKDTIYDWKDIEGNIDISLDRFLPICVDETEHIQKNLDKINKYPYGLANFPKYTYIDFREHQIILDSQTNNILQIKNSEEYRIIGILDKKISAIKIFSNIWKE